MQGISKIILATTSSVFGENKNYKEFRLMRTMPGPCAGQKRLRSLNLNCPKNVLSGHYQQ